MPACTLPQTQVGAEKNPKPRVREMLDAKRAAESFTSDAHFVGQPRTCQNVGY
jgi:hypothetical protein